MLSVAQDSDFAKYFPTSFGKAAKPKPKAEPKKVVADDGMDALRAFMPTSFGKQKAPRATSSSQYGKAKSEPEPEPDQRATHSNSNDNKDNNDSNNDQEVKTTINLVYNTAALQLFSLLTFMFPLPTLVDWSDISIHCRIRIIIQSSSSR